MTGPTLIITGASQGLGAAIAFLAAADGAQVVITARSRDALERQAQLIKQRGGKALVVPGDITRPEDCQNIVDRTMQSFGRIDVLINNAGVIEPLGPLAEVQPTAWAQLMEVNLLGPVRLCQLAIPYLRQTRGRILNVTSQGAEVSVPGASAYSASKAALNRFSKVLALEEPLITVLLLIPGDVDTPMQAVIRAKARGKTPDAFYQYFVDLHEKGQLLPPEIPARVAVDLALRAPPEWSGEILQWDEARVKEFLR